MRRSKKEELQSTCISCLVSSFLLIPIINVPWIGITIILFYFGRKEFKTLAFFMLLILIVLVIFLEIVKHLSLVGTILTSIPHPMDLCEVGVDAYRQKYLEANNPSWFFNHLSAKQKIRMMNKINEIEQWKNKKLQSYKTKDEKISFLKKYNEKAKTVFYCYIYRSGTRYTQTYYRKTPYMGTTEYYGWYFSVDYVKNRIV